MVFKNRCLKTATQFIKIRCMPSRKDLRKERQAAKKAAAVAVEAAVVATRVADWTKEMADTEGDTDANQYRLYGCLQRAGFRTPLILR